MWKLLLGGLTKGVKTIATGKTQANLGLQSPQLPNALVRLGRFGFSTSALWILVCWYSGYVNQRTPTPGPGQSTGPKLKIGGQKINTVDRPDRLPKFAASTAASSATSGTVPGGALATLATTLPGSGAAGGFVPRGAPYKPGRQDQGRDGQTTPGGPIIAPGGGRVLRVASDPNGFGPNYPIVKFTSGPYRGRILYLGHTHSALTAGASFRANQVLSYTGKTPVGNATVPGWFEIGFADSGSPGPLGQPAPF